MLLSLKVWLNVGFDGGLKFDLHVRWKCGLEVRLKIGLKVGMKVKKKKRKN